MFLVWRAFTRNTSSPCCSSTSYKAIQYTPVDCMATVFTPHDCNHSANCFSAPVQLPNSRTGCGSLPGATATKWLSLPISIPAASACITSSCGVAEFKRTSQSLRCLRFSFPLVNRSNVDCFRFFLFAMHTSSSGMGTGARLGWRSLHKLSNGVEPQLATTLSLAATEVRLKYGHKRLQSRDDHSLPRPASSQLAT